MRFSTFSLGAALLFSAACAHAQSDYDAQKAKLKPVAFDSLTELRVVGRNYLGRAVELRGEVKGSFLRGGNLALMFQVAEGESVVIDAAPSFRGLTATRPGVLSRLLCRVDGVLGSELSLTLLNATNAPEASRLFRADDESVVAPPDGASLPAPDVIMVGPDAPLSPAKTSAPVVRRVPATRAPISAARTPSKPASRGLMRPALQATARRPYFGFDLNQRTAYKELARRNNPRLSDDMAGSIADAILTASQSNNLDPRFLAAIVKVESSFDPYCLSSAGAMGLGQLMPFNLRPLGVGNAWDPLQNLSGSAKMLRRNLDTYSNQPNGTLLAVAAYHAGVGAVNRAGKAVPPRPATQKYVWKVYYAYRALAPELFN